MKSICITLLAVFLLLGFTRSTDDPTKTTIEGTWELTSFYSYDNNNVIDTIPTTDGYRQIKIYHKGKVMWTRYVPKDSVEWFGYGSYETKDGKLIETLEYGSASMMKIIDTMRVFTFQLDLKDKKYSQITLDENGNATFSENYKRLN